MPYSHKDTNRKRYDSHMKLLMQFVLGVAACLFWLGPICAVSQAEEKPPTALEVNKLSLEARTVVESFMRESFMLRMQHLYSERSLSDEDRSKLYELAKEASEKLLVVVQAQQNLKEQTEKYEGEDWDRRYGETGLWRRLFSDIYTTSASRCAIRQYLAIAAEEPEANTILQQVLSQIDTLAGQYDTGYLQYLRARTLGLLSEQKPAFQDEAKDAFSRLTERSDVSEATAFQIAIDRMRFVRTPEQEQVNKLRKVLISSEPKNAPELVVSLAIAQKIIGDWDGIEETLSQNAIAHDAFSRLALSDLEDRLSRGILDLDKVTLTEVELAAKAAGSHGPKAHMELLRKFAGNGRLHTAAVVYAYAQAVKEDNPSEACEKLIEASKLHKNKKNKQPAVSSEKIAREAVSLACSCFDQGRCGPLVVVKTVENCKELMQGQLGDDLAYVYAVALIEVGQKAKGLKLLEKMVEKPREQVLDLVRRRALNTYCLMLVKGQGKAEAERVVGLVGDVDIKNDPNLSVFKAKAFLCLDRGTEAIACLLRISQMRLCEHATEAFVVLSDIIGRIEKYELSDELLKEIGDNGLKLGRFCYNCLDGETKRIAGLYAAESQILASDGNAEKLTGAARFLDEFAGPGASDIELVRCKARLHMAQGKFEQAAGLWKQVGSFYKDTTLSETGWMWWRAKYYELLCCAKSLKIDNSDLLHTIEVLQSSGKVIPQPWAGKLAQLAQTLKTVSP